MFEKINQQNTLWIGFSGGLDSSVLLHLCVQSKLPVKAIHIHHGLSPRADEWVLHCEKFCNDLNIELITKKIQAQNLKGESPEETARQKRYAIFSEIVGEGETLVTAHHQDDQAETFLLQLFRGAGPKGLSAMPAIKSFAKGFHARPLLDFSREELQHYAEDNQLNWIEDESNANKKFSRNFIRHEVMPLLKSRWPTIQSTIARSAEQCRKQQQLLETYIQNDLDSVKLDSRLRGNDNPTIVLHGNDTPTTFLHENVSPTTVQHENASPTTFMPSPATVMPSPTTVMPAKACIQHEKNSALSVTKLLQLDSIRQQAVLRTWISQNNFILPSAIKLQHIIKNILQSRYDKTPQIQFGNCEIRRHRDELHIMKIIPPFFNESADWDFKSPLHLNHISLSAKQVIGEGLCPSLSKVTIRFRQGGEKIKLSGRQYHHDLKKLFQEWNVLPWMREHIPLIFVGEELAAVVGFGIAEKFLVKENGWIIEVKEIPDKC